MFILLQNRKKRLVVVTFLSWYKETRKNWYIVWQFQKQKSSKFEIYTNGKMNLRVLRS